MTLMRLNDQLAGKVATFPESSYGATRVTLVLVDGRRIADVVLAWGVEIVRVGEHSVRLPEQLGFDIAMVSDVEPGRSS